MAQSDPTLVKPWPPVPNQSHPPTTDPQKYLFTKEWWLFFNQLAHKGLIPFNAQIIIGGPQAIAADVLTGRYKVVLEEGFLVALHYINVTVKAQSSTSDFVADILRKPDKGVTWASIFNSGQGATLPNGMETFQASPAWAIPTLNNLDQLRVDVTADGGVTSDIQMVLSGVWVPKGKAK